MKICIPTMGNRGLNDWVGEHFGRVPAYTVVDLDTNEVKVIPNTSQHMGGQGYAPEIMAREKVKAMICMNLGKRAIGMFKDFGIDIYIGANGKVRDMVKAFKDGKLKKATIKDACGRHMFRRE